MNFFKHTQICRRLISLLTVISMTLTLIVACGFTFPQFKSNGAVVSIGNVTSTSEDGNVLIFNCDKNQVRVEFCTARTVRIQLSQNGDNGYRPDNPEYYMVQTNIWPSVNKTVTEKNGTVIVKTDAMEVRIQKSPLRVGMYDLEGNLISKDTDSTGMYVNGTSVGVKKEESSTNAGGIFGFGSGDHGRRSNLNRYNQDFSEFSMSHGRVVAPFFMSTVGYGIFLNTMEKDTVFYKKAGGFQTKNYLDYFFMYGPDFKTILNEYAEITGRMELYGKWAHGFMLSKYGNDNATQAEFLEWINRLRDEGYPCDCYVFDYGWRGDVNDNGGNQSGAGEKWGKQMWSNDIVKFPDIDAMFAEADRLGFHVGLHNNAGTPEANGGNKLYIPEYENIWVKSYMDSVITTGYGDWFWPDEFDVLGSNSAPVLSSKGAYEAWKEYTVESRPMFVTRGSYAGQHFATAWSGDINNTSTELLNQVGFSLDAGLIGYWAVSHDLGGFMKAPTDTLYTRWVSEFGAWCSIMRTHGHDGREPWLYSETSQEVLKENLRIRYSLYPYIYTMAWQGYSQGTPMMRAMILEDGSQYNPDAWNLNEQYYFGDWFLVAPAADTADTVVNVWLPPNTVWYDYTTGERYEGGANGRTITVAAPLEEIPVFVKAGAIVPMGPEVDYADELPLNPLTLDIYPHGTTSYTLYEDDGESRRYITENAYSTTTYTCIENGKSITFKIGARVDNNPKVYTPDDRSYNLKFNNISVVRGVKLNGKALTKAASLDAYNNAEQAYWLDSENSILYVKVIDTAQEMTVVLDSDGVDQPELGDYNQGVPATRIESGDKFELENALMLPTAEGQVVSNSEWKGYTGTGFAKGFKASGDAIELTVNIVKGGTYDLILRVNNGKKNDPRYDSTPRTAGLYIDTQKQSDLAFEVTSTWGDSNKNGVWKDYTIANVKLTAGTHVIRIVAEGSNPGNFNLDSLTFAKEDTSTNAFSLIEAEKASVLTDMTVDGNLIKATKSGAWACFSEIKGENKGGISITLKSSTGGSLIVYENGVGDKILGTLELPSDNKLQTIEFSCKNTDAVESNIYFEFVAKEGKKLDVSVDSFSFIRKINAYQKFSAVIADIRNNINIRDNNKLVNIYNGSYAVYKDLDFADGGLQSIILNYACNTTGGSVEVYIDSLDTGNLISTIPITSTKSWTNFVNVIGECKDVTGVHDVYLKFVNSTGVSVCDLMFFTFSKSTVTVGSEIIGDSGSLQISNDMADPGDTVVFQILGLKSTHSVEGIKITDKDGNEVPYTAGAGTNQYSFVLPESAPVKISVTVGFTHIQITDKTVIELEEGKGATNENSDALRVDVEWSGFSGSGYVAGWKTKGNYVEVTGNVTANGMYELVLTGASGKKNGAQYDNSPRTGALYIDGVKYADFGLEIQNSWGTWIDYTFEPVYLKAGLHTFKIVAEGSSNPGNFNLDCLTFNNALGDEKLTALIESCEALDKNAYTETSFKAMEAALANAKTIVKASNATLSSINNAYVYLKTTVNSLVKTAPESKELAADGKSFKAFVSTTAVNGNKYAIRIAVLAKLSELNDLSEVSVKMNFVTSGNSSAVEKKLTSTGGDFTLCSSIVAAGVTYTCPEGYGIFTYVIDNKTYDDFMLLDFSINKNQGNTPVLEAKVTSFGIFTGMYCTPSGKYEEYTL